MKQSLWQWFLSLVRVAKPITVKHEEKQKAADVTQRKNIERWWR